MPATDTLTADAPPTRERLLRHALDNIAAAASDLLATVTVTRGRYPENATFHMHEQWAADVLRAELACARITLGEVR